MMLSVCLFFGFICFDSVNVLLFVRFEFVGVIVKIKYVFFLM